MEQRSQSVKHGEAEAETSRQYFVRAMYEGLRDAMREDETVVLLGEDVSRGVMGTSKGLIEEFGPERVRDTPISETTMAGVCVGAAAAGLKPVLDLMFASFIYLAMDPLANQAAKLRYMSGGQVSVPIVVYATAGPSGSAAAQHSESPHPLLMGLPGLKVVVPSCPADAKGLMYSAIFDPDPVVFLQEAVLGGMKGEVPTQVHSVPLGVASTRRCGTDVTLVGVGAMANEALDAADLLDEQDGIAADVIDMRSLAPLDLEAVVDSVSKTGRLVVCDSARATCGAASEICARVTERAFSALASAPVSVTHPDAPMPFSPALEEHLLPTKETIAAAVRRSVGKER